MNTTQGDTNDALRITSSSGISNTRRTNRRRHRFAWAARVLLGYLLLIVVEIVDRLGDTWLMRRLVNLIARHFSRWWPEPGPVRRMWRRTRQRAHPGLVALAERYHRFRREPDFDDWTIEHRTHSSRSSLYSAASCSGIGDGGGIDAVTRHAPSERRPASGSPLI